MTIKSESHQIRHREINYESISDFRDTNAC